MTKNTSLENITTQIRRDILRMVHKVNSGHPGGSLGCAEFMVTLFNSEMKRNKSFAMDGIDEDVFFLSNGHISPVFYSVLARCGYFDVDELNTFRLINSRLQGHPTTHEGLPGVRIASGSLGQGLSVAIGAALSKKLNHDSNLVYCLMGDGELQEGQNWEAIMFASTHKLSNITLIIDYNNLQGLGFSNSIIVLNSLEKKLISFGWMVTCINGHNIKEITNSLKKSQNKPHAIIAKTIKGYGLKSYQNKINSHYFTIKDNQELKKLIKEIEQ